MKKIYFTLIAFIAILMVTSCSKEEFETTPASAEPVEEAPAYLNPDYVNVDWSKAEVTSYDSENCEFSFHLSGNMPDIKPGSILTVDADTAGCVCIVESCIINGQDVHVKGHSGEIYDVFGNTEMILSTEDMSEADFTKALSGDVLIGQPEAVIICDENGVAESHPWTDTKAYNKLINFTYSKYNSRIYTGSEMNIDLINNYMHFDLGLYMYVNFGAFGSPKQIDMYLDGNANISEKVGLNVKRAGGASTIPFTIINNFVNTKIKFMVGWVPIYITFDADLMAKVTANTSCPNYYTDGFNENFSFRVGFYWSKNSGIQPNNYASNNFSFLTPTLSYNGTIDSKTYVYPCFTLKLYDIIGPFFEIMPYIGVDATKSNGAMHGYRKIGIDADAGVSFLGNNFVLGTRTIWSKNYMTF